MKRLIIARHGNTFRSGETPTRVGAKTDLPLVEEERGRSIGKYLKEKGMVPNKVYAAPLKRTMETAALAIEEMNPALKIIPKDDFIEIDYGPDENKTEDAVIERLGKEACAKEGIDNPSPEEITERGQQVIDLWNEKAIVPDGWHVDVDGLISVWKEFAESIEDGETVLLVSSNGVIRFAPHITESYDDFCARYDIKVATGSVGVFEFADNTWTCTEWNTKPFKLYR